MPLPELYPLTFAPVFKEYPWGGRALGTRLGRAIPEGIVAESWEIAAHVNGATQVDAGPLAGWTLLEVLDEWGEALVGRRSAAELAQGRFPLLIKLLDANRWLSVQVHPNDAYALAHAGDLGKTEMWVILAAEPGAEVIYGFRAGVDRAIFARAVEAGESERWLHRMPVQAGDVVFVPAGAIHALGPGLIVAEIQQNSDTTYRIYDWGRPRPLHIAQALEVLDFGLVEPGPVQPQPVAGAAVATEVIGECAYFRTERLYLAQGERYAGACDGATFEIWGVMAGAAELHWRGERLRRDAVSWVLLPAALGEFAVEAVQDSTLLRVIRPEARHV
ncbi:MAG: class I mannose-6-phosphate isomerase [Caldilineaceae bacterium]|nr:class I mannose-6-phosphate isomerase [Caldilineaceae bacterium]